MKFRRKLPKFFFCSACLLPSATKKSPDLRESFNCLWCGCTSRERAVLLGVHWAVIRSVLGLRHGKLNLIGISDGHRTEVILKKIYRNKYRSYNYHQEPFLDITSVSNVGIHGTASVICCSEVLEHVAPPINLAFSGLFSILKPGGILILSVPHSQVGEGHVEHFPILTQIEVTVGSIPTLKGIDEQGNSREFSDLTFHGGVGATLEFRIFSEDSLVDALHKAGFVKLRKTANHPFLGIKWEPWSRVWIALKPRDHKDT